MITHPIPTPLQPSSARKLFGDDLNRLKGELLRSAQLLAYRWQLLDNGAPTIDWVGLTPEQFKKDWTNDHFEAVNQAIEMVAGYHQLIAEVEADR